MTVVVDTSLWVALFRDKSGRVGSQIEAANQAADVAMLLPIRFELLQGCRGTTEWLTMLKRVDAFESLQMTPSTWDGAARLYFELRQSGRTVRSALDCLIAQSCLEHDCTLLHNDRDFETIATVVPLKHRRLDPDNPTQ